MERRMKNLLMLVALGAPMTVAAEQVTSPDGAIVVDVDIAEGGVPTYKVDYKGKPVVLPSRLGFTLASESSRRDFSADAVKTSADALQMTSGFAITDIERGAVDETWASRVGRGGFNPLQLQRNGSETHPDRP